VKAFIYLVLGLGSYGAFGYTPKVGCSAHFDQDAYFDNSCVGHHHGDLNSPQVYFEDYNSFDPNVPALVVANVPLQSYRGDNHSTLWIRIYLRKGDSQFYKMIVIPTNSNGQEVGRLAPSFGNTAFPSDANGFAHIVNGWRDFKYSNEGSPLFDGYSTVDIDERITHINCTIGYETPGQQVPAGGTMAPSVADP
jgi:hypothetical protein